MEWRHKSRKKPGDCRAKPIRPESDSQKCVIGQVSENFEANTTYNSVFQKPENEDKEQAFRWVTSYESFLMSHFRPIENGVIYEIGETSSMTTTHDRAYTTEQFPAQRKIPQQADDSDKEREKWIMTS